MTVLGLFAGPGGWDVGLALLGMEALGIEVDEVCCATRSEAGLQTQRADVARLEPMGFDPVEGLIASPPCQDWSVAGTLTKRDGHTGWLVDEPVRWVEALRPTWIAQEQVTGALPVWEEQARIYRRWGYHTWTGILSAEQYGVPQTRARAFLMAHRDWTTHPPEPTHQRYVHGQRAEATHGLFGTLRPWVSMAEALGWDGRVGFPRRDDGRGDSEDGYRDRDWRGVDEPAFVLTEKARSWVVDTRCDVRDGTTQERSVDEPAPTVTTRSGRQWQLKDPHLHMKSSNLRPTARPLDEPAQALAFGHNAAGWQWDDGPAIVHRPWPHDRPATTVCGDPRLTAPQHHYHGEQGRAPVDSVDVRNGEDPGVRPIKIEPWEAAVLQSFPADYPFTGSRTRQFAQIGDAVPPFLAAAVIGALVGQRWQDAIARLLYPEEFS